MSARIELKEKVLAENDRLADDLRQEFRAAGIVALNLVSSPGSGKTSLLERTLKALNNRLRIALVAGDVQTENDARRLQAAGGKIVRSVITGGACHLDAKMITEAVSTIDLSVIDLLLIENVGNLVCPSSYDLGEDMKVVVISTTEGDDKPLKYPAMFRRSGAMVINKTDLLGLSDFELSKVITNARAINSALKMFQISCRTGDGLPEWYDWLAALVKNKKAET